MPSRSRIALKPASNSGSIRKFRIFRGVIATNASVNHVIYDVNPSLRTGHLCRIVWWLSLFPLKGLTAVPLSIRRWRFTWAFILVFALTLGTGASGSNGSGSKGSGSKTVHVKGHTRKDGTYVPPHTRSAPTSKKAGEKSSSGAKTTTTARPLPNPSVNRDQNGRIQRSASARHAFARQTGFPNGRPGFVVDHIVPLACGGADAPSNMQWQTVEQARLKDKTERMGC